MNDYFPLGITFVQKKYLPFEPVSMLFRSKQWSTKEMVDAMDEVATTAIQHYFGKN